MTSDRAVTDPAARDAPSDDRATLQVHIVGGGTPTDAQEAAIAIAVRRTITRRDLSRSAPAPLWGVVGRLESRDGRTIRSRSMLPRTSG